jgi:hypothetical protein
VPLGGTKGNVLTVDSAEATGVKWAAGGGGGLTNITETLKTSAPNNINNSVILAVTGGSTNADLILQPKGNGGIAMMWEGDDGTDLNPRGIHSADFTTNEGFADYIISGNYCGGFGYRNRVTVPFCFSSGKNNNITGGSHSAAIGDRITITAAYGFGAGQLCDVTGESAHAIGTNLVASAYAARATGSYAVASRQGMTAHSSYAFAATGDSQQVGFVMRGKTTTNSAVELRMGVNSVRLTIPIGKVFSGAVNIVGVKSDGTAVARYLRQVTIKNVAGTTSLVGSVITLGTDEAAGTSVSITADDTNDALKIEVTGITSETWRWVATIEGAEVAYGN